MSAAESLYPYAEGARLDERNHYFYSQFHGAVLLEAWGASRSEALHTLAQGSASVQEVDAGPANGTRALLETIGERLGRRERQGFVALDALVQRFEVSKRIHGAYGSGMRPRHADDFRDLSLYVRLAELAEQAYVQANELPYLNVLLKLLDTLTACRDSLPPNLSARLGRLIVLERAHVGQFASSLGLSVPCG